MFLLYRKTIAMEIIKKSHSTLFQHSEAEFSACEKYRYRLTRTWQESLPGIAFLMLNPSTADEMYNDPTIERCQRRAVEYGYGKMVIINLFPYRETDSQLLTSIPDLYGDIDTTNQHILDVVRECQQTIAGWGSHPMAMARAREIYQLLAGHGLSNKIFALDVNADGNPKHPLYIAYSAKPASWAPVMGVVN